MKTFMKLLTLVIVFTFVAGCAGTPPTPTVAPTSVPPTAPPTLTPQETWLKTNELGQFDTGKQDWAAIEAAAIKEGKVIVYANSSKITKAAEMFMEKYPGITVEGFDLGGDDVLAKTLAEQQSGAFTGDVWFSSGGAELVGTVMPHNYVWRFVPDSLTSVVNPAYTQPLLISRFGTRILAYNKELNDTCPVTNIWQLTDPEWKGKFFIEDPLNDASTLSILLTFVSHKDEMKAAYVALYGKDPVLDADTPDAGWLWLKKFAQNGPIPEPGGDEVDAAFATPGMTESYMAFTSYSNYPDVLDGNLAFEPCWDVQPVIGVQSQSYLGILNQAPHPNAAKLWILFIMNEGAEPWSKFGSYQARTDAQVPEGQMPLADMLKISWFIDEQFAYDNMIQARDFYLVNLGK